MTFTEHEQAIIDTLKEVLTETECVYSDDLIANDPKVLRGALSSLIKKGVLDVDKDYPSNINGTTYYPVTYWDDALMELDQEFGIELPHTVHAYRRWFKRGE